MKNSVSKSLFAAVLLTAVALGSAAHAASKYPRYAVTINTSKAGSIVDYVARTFVKSANKYFPKKMIVTSAAGQIGAVRETINAEPDGYTLCIVNNTVIINDVTGGTDFNSIDGVTILGTVGENVSNWIAIRTELAEKGNIKTLADLFRYSQEHPQELTITDRPASNTHIVSSALVEAGLDAVGIDIGLSTDRLTNFLAGNCDVFLGAYGLIEQYIEKGDVICLAVCANERTEFSPDVPSTGELGYPDLYSPATYYICGPKDLPADVTEIIGKLVEQVTADPEFAADLASNTISPKYRSAEDAYKSLSDLKQQMIDLGMGKGFQG